MKNKTIGKHTKKKRSAVAANKSGKKERLMFTFVGFVEFVTFKKVYLVIKVIY